jgi:hypothetical protein
MNQRQPRCPARQPPPPARPPASCSPPSAPPGPATRNPRAWPHSGTSRKCSTPFPAAWTASVKGCASMPRNSFPVANRHIDEPI